MCENSYGIDLKGMTVSQEMTTPSRPGKKPRAVWIVRGTTGAHTALLKSLGGRLYHGSWSFWEDPSESLAEALAAGAEPTFAEVYAQEQEALRERRLARADRLEDWAGSATKKSEAHYKVVRQTGDMIPLGQPILVDHYSAPRHRRDIGRMDSNMRKSVENADKAANHLGKAARLRHMAEDAPKSPTYINNRIQEAKTQIGILERALQGKSYVHSAPREISAEARARYEGLLALEREKLTYWQERLEESGGARFSKANIAKGDNVKIRGSWEKVARANPTTVSVVTGYSWTMKYAYAEIQDHQPAGTEAKPAGDEAQAQGSESQGEGSESR
ncbi:DUF3560 domain-containing protein [Capsulimonas corticalis]|nr:DUF3560 domain-containing protein [Capsulimonas corticalis]